VELFFGVRAHVEIKQFQRQVVVHGVHARQTDTFVHIVRAEVNPFRGSRRWGVLQILNPALATSAHPTASALDRQLVVAQALKQIAS